MLIETCSVLKHAKRSVPSVQWDIPFAKIPLESYHKGCSVAHFLCLFVFVLNTIRLSRHVKIIHKSQTIWTNWPSLKFSLQSLDELDDDDGEEKEGKMEESLTQHNTVQNEALISDPEAAHSIQVRVCVCFSDVRG